MLLVVAVHTPYLQAGSALKTYIAWKIYKCIFCPTCLSLSLFSIYLSILLPVHLSMSIYLSYYLSICLLTQSIYLYIYLYPSLYLPVHLYIYYLSIYLPICLSMHPSIHPSICMYLSIPVSICSSPCIPLCKFSPPLHFPLNLYIFHARRRLEKGPKNEEKTCYVATSEIGGKENCLVI